MRRGMINRILVAAAVTLLGIRPALSGYDQYSIVTRYHLVQETTETWDVLFDRVATIDYDGYGVGATILWPGFLGGVLLNGISVDWFDLTAKGTVDYNFRYGPLVESTRAVVDQRELDASSLRIRLLIVSNLIQSLGTSSGRDNLFDKIVRFTGLDGGFSLEHIRVERPYGVVGYGTLVSTGQRAALFREFETVTYEYTGIGINYSVQRELLRGLVLQGGFSMKGMYANRESPAQTYGGEWEQYLDNFQVMFGWFAHLAYELDLVTSAWGVAAGYQYSEDGILADYSYRGAGNYTLENFDMPTESIVLQAFVRF